MKVTIERFGDRVTVNVPHLFMIPYSESRQSGIDFLKVAEAFGFCVFHVEDYAAAIIVSPHAADHEISESRK